MAAPNLSINGLPVTPDSIVKNSSKSHPSGVPEEAYEPFDTRKRQRVAELISQEEKLLEEVAGLKRSVPAAAAKDHADKLRESLRRDDEMLRQKGERLAAAGAGDGVAFDGVKPLGRQETVEAEFKSAVEALGRLKSDMPAVVAKMERARVAGEYVVAQAR